MLGGHDCRDPVVTPDRLKHSAEAPDSLGHIRSERTLQALGECLLTHGFVMRVSVFPWDFLKVRHTVTGMLEGWNPAHSWTDSITKDQRILESVFQSKWNFHKYVCMFLKKCWSMIGRSFYPLLTDLLRVNNCLHGAPFDFTTEASRAPYLTSETHHRPFQFYKSGFPCLWRKRFTAILTLPTQAKHELKG